MTPEAQTAADFLALSARISTVLDAPLSAHPWVKYGLAAVAVGGLLFLRPASTHPSTATPLKGRAGPPRTDRTGRRGLRAQRVDKRREPPAKVFAVPMLIPHGPLPRRRWRWGLPPWEWECRGYVTTVLGIGGVGKSFVLEDLGIAALTGGKWFGLDVRRARTVLYVDAELDVEECERRAHPLARGRGYEAPPAGLHYLNITGHTLAPVKEKLVDGTEREYQPGIDAIAEAVRRLKPDLILLDSITIGSPGATASDEKAWNKIYSALELFGCPVVAIDHMDKAAKGAYGSFMKQAKVRSCITLTRRGDALLVEQIKSNFGPKAAPFAVYAEFQDDAEPDYIVRYGTEPPLQEHASIAPDALSIHQEGPPVDGAAEPAMPTPLRLVPVAGKEGTRRDIYEWVAAHAPLPRQAIVKGIEAAGRYKPATTQLHLKAMLAEGVLVERDGALALPGDATAEATG